ncbi:alpha-1,3-mannosyl-glycoprotein 4-beta-N-acetylglucosaminyltransferase B-like [Chiloscyllium plagiosum]|uniref:alpha-1,3-mannosyl-glycoprotein 4-beta-N-acetylglucosaminyltransferase B-like n=1 Tax=Chiloscyllium plagiosum TaxID=36176 RepID=UPI001CB8809E|nr:alpha-1,3-mannosyl-glycoprotein 4-beta-N-acetylglucosaminyltransferase B-like [Chiloscyllium plagiosum]
MLQFQAVTFMRHYASALFDVQLSLGLVCTTFLLVHRAFLCSVLRFFFRSGNIEHPGDKLFNTTVEVLPFDTELSWKETLLDGKDKTPKYQRTEDGYIRIAFFVNGIAEGVVDPMFGPLEVVRLSTLSDSPVWVILSEIFIKKAET